MTDRMHPFLFYLMAARFWFRYRSSLPKEAIAEAGAKPGDTVLDFGCGPGGFSIAAAAVAGPKGKVYALDIMPLAARFVARRARKAGVDNVTTITSGRETGLADGSVDVILLYDILHHLSEPEPILAGLSRVLKGDGRLSVSDHHMKEDGIVSGITKSGHFRLEKRGAHTYTFTKVLG